MYDDTMEWIKEDYGASMSEMYNTTNLMQDAYDRKKKIQE